MNISIEKQLEKNKSNESKRLDEIQEVKLLLNSEEQEDLRILEGLSENSQLQRAKHLTGKKLELEKLDTKYDGKTYHIDEIKKLAIRYHLRFLPSRHYTGSFDMELTSKIKEFSKKANVQINESSLKYNFYILAPEEMFELKEEKYITKRQLDPVIFYQTPENQDCYRLIHKWGADFTFLRLIQGYENLGFWQYFLVKSIKVFPIFLMLSFVIFRDPITFFQNHTFCFFVINMFLSMLISYLFLGVYKRHDETKEVGTFFSPLKWNVNVKLK